MIYFSAIFLTFTSSSLICLLANKLGIVDIFFYIVLHQSRIDNNGLASKEKENALYEENYQVKDGLEKGDDCDQPQNVAFIIH